MEDLDILLPQVTIEEVVEAAHKFAETWQAIGVQLTEAADLIRDAFSSLFREDESTTKEDAAAPRKHTTSLRRCPRKVPVHYNYIPIQTRNLPYQRRAY